MSESLNEFLSAASNDGRLDSGGVFTLDVDKARSKLQAFQLADPYLYVVHLVATAVLARAHSLRVAPTHNTMTFEFDGEPYSADELHGLMGHLLAGSDTDKRLQELAIAVSGARSTGAEGLVFETHHAGGRGFRLELHGEEQLRVEAVEEIAPGNRLTLRYPTTLARMAGLFEKSRPEVDVLQRFCARGPINISCEGRLLSSTLFAPQEFFAWKYWASEQWPWRLVRVEGAVVRQSSWDQPFGLVLTLINPMFAEVQGLSIILNGVQFRRPSGVLGCPFACGLIYATHLNKNVSHTDLVEDQTYHEMIEVARARVDELWEELARNPQHLPKGYRSHLIHYLKGRFKSEARPEAIDALIVRLEIDRNVTRDRSEEYLEEAARFQAEGESERAQIIRQKVLEAMNGALFRDYPKKLNEELLLAARLRARALADLQGGPDANAEELSQCLSALLGERVPPPTQTGPWQRLRWCLMAMAVGEFDAARVELKRLGGSGGPWRDFLQAELDEDIALYARLAELENSYLIHEAAAAHRRAGEHHRCFEYRCRADQLRHPARGLFLKQLVHEASGKVGFASLLPFQIKSHLYAIDKRVKRLATSFRRHEITPDYAEQALEIYSFSSPEFLYLSHVLIWSWREQDQELWERSLRFRARNLLHGAILARPDGLIVVDRLDPF